MRPLLVENIIMECKKIKCKDTVFKIGLCKKHFYNRKMVYRYQGHLSQIKNEEIKRKCLHCDKMFLSTGNRMCEFCNSSSYDMEYSSISSYVSCS